MTLEGYKNSLGSKGLAVFGMTEKSLDTNKTLGGRLQIFELYVETLKRNGTVQGNNQLVRVLDIGTPEEEAFPMNAEVSDEPETPFRDLVRSYLDSTHISPAIPKITIDQVNETDEFAIVTAYVVTDNIDSNGDPIAGTHISPKKYFLYRDSNGDPVFMEYLG